MDLRVKAPTKLAVVQVAELPVGEEGEDWLVRSLWARAGVGFLFGIPKSSKTWVGLDLAVSVASGTPCLGRFPVEDPGPVLAYVAEDAAKHVRARIAALCEHRELSLPKLPLYIITDPVFRLDLDEHLTLLRASLEELRPRLLFLDPFVRLHRKSENDAQEISALLGDLREIQREFDVAVALVHHSRKRPTSSPGESLRGSSDLYAWVDSAVHVAKLEDERRRITLEHRSAPSPAPILIELTSRADGTCSHLRVLGETTSPEDRPAETLASRVVSFLADRRAPTTTTALRQELGVRNQTLKRVLDDLEQQGTVIRQGRAGWVLASSDEDQRALPLG